MSENVMANSKENTEAAAAPQDARRRRFLASSAVAGLAGAGLSLGFAIPFYNINFVVHPQQTQSVTFIADKPGVFWCFCTNFCHALHLEMRSRMLVEA